MKTDIMKALAPSFVWAASTCVISTNICGGCAVLRHGALQRVIGDGSSGVGCLPFGTCTASAAGGGHGASSLAQAIPAAMCSRSCRQAGGSGASEPGPAGSETASTRMPSDY